MDFAACRPVLQNGQDGDTRIGASNQAVNAIDCIGIMLSQFWLRTRLNIDANGWMLFAVCAWGFA